MSWFKADPNQPIDKSLKDIEEAAREASQRSAEQHSKEDERKLLGLLAALKTEFGLTDRYQIEGWRPGRE